MPCDVVAQGLASHRSTGPIEDGRWFQPDDGHWSGRKRRVVAPIGEGVALPVVQDVGWGPYAQRGAPCPSSPQT